MHRRDPIRTLSLLALFAALTCAGCASNSSDLPRDRLGALPFPGLFTLYTTADPQNLGPHRYEREARFFETDETERGIFYTTQAGFLDMAHIRMAIDWTRYCTYHIRSAMEDDRTELDLMGSNGAVFHLTLRYPDDWHQLTTANRTKLADELALHTGEQLTYLILTWHELITWFGHHEVILVSEQPSAFTYDDVMSHVIGLRVADRAMRDTDRPYDDAVTVALQDELHALGAVTPAQTAIANRKVEGIWWSNGKPLKRQLDIGLSDGIVHPWLVRGLPFTPDAESKPFPLPSMKSICGRDMSNFYSVEIDPRIPEAVAMRKYLPGRPARFSADCDVPLLFEVAREQMMEEFTAAVEQSWPTPAAQKPALVHAANTPQTETRKTAVR